MEALANLFTQSAAGQPRPTPILDMLRARLGQGGRPTPRLDALRSWMQTRPTPQWPRPQQPAGQPAAAASGAAPGGPAQRLASVFAPGGKGPRPTGVPGRNVSVHSPGDIAAATGTMSPASIGLGLVGPPFSGVAMALANALANMGYAGVVHDPALSPQDPALRSAISQANDMTRQQRSTVSVGGQATGTGGGMAGGFGGSMSRGLSNASTGRSTTTGVSVGGSRENDGSGMAGGFGGSMSGFGGGSGRSGSGMSGGAPQGGRSGGPRGY